MITFSPIQKLIQETLQQKMRMLDKIPAFEINEPTTDEGGVPQENYMFTRSVFLRMTSLLTVDNKPIVLMGGEILDGKYRKGLEPYGPKSGGFEEENPNLRPMAGINDVSVEYAGGGMRIGATRTTTITWTCWSWEELQKFKPFFLKHGRAVLIEFGWGFTGKDSPMMLPIIRENGEINSDVLFGNQDKKIKPLQERLPEYILEQKGHYDAVLGTIKNFEFTVNETGGFNCTTELISMGVNTFRRMDSKEAMTGNISNLPIMEPAESGMWWWKETDFLKTQYKNLNPYYNFTAYMETLEGHLHLNAKSSKGAIAYILGNREPYVTWGWFEDNVLSRFAGQINSDSGKVIGEFRSIESIYDDDGKIIGSKPTMMRCSTDLMPVDFSPKGWFWVDPRAVPDELGMDTKTLKENNNYLIPGMEVLIDSDETFTGGYSSMNRNSIYPLRNSQTWRKLGDFKLMFGPPYVQKAWANTGKYWTDTKGYENHKWIDSFNNGSKEWNYNGSYFRAFTTNTGDNGIIRNIYFGHEFLTECFSGATIAEGVESVWNKFSAAYGGIYDFGIEFDDKEGRLMIKDKEFAESKVHKVLENTSKKPKGEVYDSKGVFVFPIWEKNSIVKTQNLSAKLPNRMQMAAMYGNNAPKMGTGILEDSKDWGAIALGRNERRSELNELQQKVLYEKLQGDVEHPFRRVPAPDPKFIGPVEDNIGEQFTFGRADADGDQPLQWRKGTSPQTTNIYEDLSKGRNAKNTDNDKFGKGINEFLETQLEREFKRRLLKNSGLSQDDLATAADATGVGLDYLGKTVEEQKKKIEESKDAFKLATTKSEGVKDLYETPYMLRTSNSSGVSIKEYPNMKPEYKGIMKMALKESSNGLLKKTDPLIPIELEIEIDGTGGIFPGNSFHSSYLPKSYMDYMCFQVIGASHQLSAEGWTTTLKGQMRTNGMPKQQPNRDIPQIKLDGTFSPEERQEIEEDPGMDIMEIPDVTDSYEGDTFETIQYLAPDTRPIEQPPILPLKNDKKKKDDSKIYILQRDEDIKEQDMGYTLIGRLEDFDVSQGTPIPKTTTVGSIFKIYDDPSNEGNLYKPGPSGDGVTAKGVPIGQAEQTWGEYIGSFFD